MWDLICERAVKKNCVVVLAQASLEDYERVPIEAFGAALLRGMGWKEGEALGSGKFKGCVKRVCSSMGIVRRKGPVARFLFTCRVITICVGHPQVG
jgi:hypothetical protein